MKTICCFMLWVSGIWLLFPHPAAAQETSKGYLHFDSYGKKVYLIPDQIAKQTMDATLNVQLPAEAIELPPEYVTDIYQVQVGSFVVALNAYRVKEKLEKDGYSVFLWEWHSPQMNTVFHVVSIGNCATADNAKAILNRLKTSYQLEGRITVAKQREGQSQASSLLR
jgi:hypothetical protein